jgi:signal transduction histidine kinase
LSEVETLLSTWDRLARADARVVDWVLAGALTVLTQIQIGASAGPAAHAALLCTMGVAFRRRWPLGVAMLTAVGAAAQGLADNPPSVLGEYIAITLVVYTVAAYESLLPAIAGGALIAVGIILHDLPSTEYGSASGMASDLTTPVLFWFVGRAVRLSRGRAALARAEGAELAEQAVADERRHLARELHDVVTHGLGVVVLQAQGARRFVGGREPEVSEALEVIERSGRSSLVEMRRLLGLLRDDEGGASLRPQPRVSELGALAESLRGAGLDVTLEVRGRPAELEPAIDLSAYRIVQEALTNTLKHARASHACVVVSYGPQWIDLEITDNGNPNGSTPGTGRGLVGMRERAGFFGGRLEHGPLAAGGYRVFASLPLEQSP